MKRVLKRFYVWLFNLAITQEEAKKLNLHFEMNVYGDGINLLGCRSIWLYKQSRKLYRVDSLVEE